LKKPILWEIGQHSLADVLRKTRLEKGLLQKEAAVKIGVAEDTYSFWERGLTYPVPEKAEAIRRFLSKNTSLLRDKLLEFKEKIWTASQVCKKLEINRHTFEAWMGKYKKFKPKHGVDKRRQIFTKFDLANLKKLAFKSDKKSINH
jgi:transcriptional regulator with XRE-family HTH domain